MVRVGIVGHPRPGCLAPIGYTDQIAPGGYRHPPPIGTRPMGLQVTIA